MNFGVDKCTKATFFNGRLKLKENIEALEDHEVHKYLSIEENDGIQLKRMREKLRKECYRRTRALLKTEMSGKNKNSAITTLAVLVIQYSFGIIEYTQTDLRKL